MTETIKPTKLVIGDDTVKCRKVVLDIDGNTIERVMIYLSGDLRYSPGERADITIYIPSGRVSMEDFETEMLQNGVIEGKRTELSDKDSVLDIDPYESEL